ncbi:MAG TPA: hypothetical protein GX696_06610 [Pseudomonadaceae bacterium]|nr:hypothetical protein [Pseudomonadaceae bacterium]
MDGVPVQKKEYDAAIAELADEGVFKLLTSPTYFNEQLHWRERRKLLLDVCGDISDADVIASDKQLAKLPDLIGKRSLEDHRKVIAARRAEINRELERIPVRIDEAKRALPDIAGLVPSELDADIEKLKSQQRDLDQQLLRIEGGGEAAEVRKQLREAEADLLDMRNKHREQADRDIGQKRRELNAAVTSAQLLDRDRARMANKIERAESEIKQLEETNVRLREQWNEVAKRELVMDQADTCPTCGQAIPAWQLEEAREKALADFNRRRAQDLETITAKGKANNERIMELKIELVELNKKHDSLKSEIAELTKQADALKTEIDELAAGVTDIATDLEYMARSQIKVELEARLKQLATDQQAATSQIRREITSINQAISALQTSKLQIQQHTQGENRIAELMDQERKLATEYEQLEQELYLTELFVKTKVALLEERINSKFKLARFRLFETQINGGLSEVCETTFNGVPYSGGLNNAARIAVGLDIISTLSEHYGFSAPIFIDNAEAVVKLPNVDSQVIALYVSEEDKALRTEVVK